MRDLTVMCLIHEISKIISVTVKHNCQLDWIMRWAVKGDWIMVEVYLLLD